MEKFEFYANKNGVIWYRCNYCNALSRGKPNECPVCHSIPKETRAESELSEKALDAALDKFKKLLDKYQNI